MKSSKTTNLDQTYQVKLCLKESTEQEHFVQWLKINEYRFNGLSLAFATNNGGWLKNYAMVNKMKKMGMKNGVPDIVIPVPRGRYHGLFIEMKRTSGSQLSAEQKKYIVDLNILGYKAEIAYGCDDAIRITEEYFRGK